MTRKCLLLLTIALSAAMLIGCSVPDMLGLAPTSTPTPTKTFVPTFTSTPITPPTDTPVPEPTSTPEPTTPPVPPTPTEPPTATVGPPTNTPVPPPPAPTATPKPPPPTNTPQPVYEYELIQEPTKDFCHPGYCLPEVSGMVLNAEGNPVDRYSVAVKIDSPVFGVLYCAVGDEKQVLQPGQFKFGSPDGRVFGEYSLTVVRGVGDPTPLSATYPLGGAALAKGQHTNIVFRHK